MILNSIAQDDLSSQIIIIVILLLINAFFAASEMAIISANPLKIDMLIANGNKKAERVKKLQENETKLLSTIQVGITLAGFFSSATAASTLSEILAQSIGIPNEISLIFITLILSYFTLVFGELFPKRIALLAPEKVAMAFALPITIVKTLFRPIVFILSVSSDLLVKIFGIKPKEDEKVTEDEITAMINNGVDDGTINSNEQEMIERIFVFDNLYVKDIMTPRINVFMLDINTPIGKFKKAVKEEQYTRVPIYEDDKDNILGILNLKDVFLFLNASYTTEDIRGILRAPIFVSESMKCKTLLKELKLQKSQSAIVIDKNGSVSGYVTLEDVIEEITGNIYDEHDEIISYINKVGENEYIVDASISILDINKELDLGIDYKNERYTTIAGYITYHNEILPKEGEEFIINNLKINIITVENNRIKSVKITLL